MPWRLPVIAVILFACVAVPARAEGERPLPVDEAVTVRVTPQRPAVFRFEADKAGGLAVVARGEDGLDLALELTDDTGQAVYNGYGDGDWFGDLAWEQAVLPMPREGVYRLYVDAIEGDGEVEVLARVLPFPRNAMPADPLGSPTQAAALEPGAWTTQSIRPQRGDLRDWYRLEATRDGVVTALLQGEGDTDFILEAFTEHEFRAALRFADDTDPDRLGDESITLEVSQGEPIYFRVWGYSQDDAGDYRFMAGYVGGAE